MSGDELRLRAEMGDVEGLKMALAGGANPCSRDAMGLTALHYAVWNGHLSCAEVLCANHLGVDEEAIEARKQKEEEERLAKEKAERKARKEAKKKESADGGGGAAAAAKPATPSSKFAMRKQQEADALAAKEAAENKSDEIANEGRVSCIDLQSSMGLSPLHLAAMESPDGPRLINLLLLCDARVDLRDVEGCTALDRAKNTGRVRCEDAIAESTVTRAERDSFRTYMDTECKVQPQKEKFAENPRLKGYELPPRMPVMPRELTIPEQFTLPYAKANFEAPRGREPLLNLGWADEEIKRNLGRREMLATSKDRQIERETGISLEISEVEEKRRERLRKKQLEEEEAEKAALEEQDGGGPPAGSAVAATTSKVTEQTSFLTGDT